MKIRYLAVMTGLFALVGCGETEIPVDVEPCIAVAVQVKGADGQCVWASSCDVNGQELCEDSFECWELPPDACALDSRCQLSEQMRCPDCLPEQGGDNCRCGGVQVCEPKDAPNKPCTGLDEASCMATPGCQGEYGWLSGTQGAAPMPMPDEPDEMRPPTIPEWGYLACVEASSNDRCEGLDVDACVANPACEPVWGSAPCDCEPGGMCACPDIAIYEACVSKPNSGCAVHVDPWTCDGVPGCHWEYYYDDMPYPCDCPPGSDCLCAAPAPNGACVPDYEPVECWSLGSADACYAAGCNWVDGWGDAPPMPCECFEGESCACDPIMVPGYCEDPRPRSCYDYYDEYSCGSAGCIWFESGSEDCVCDPSGACECSEKRPWGYCGFPVSECEGYGDELSCLSNPSCDWAFSDQPIPDPCDCGPDAEDCLCFWIEPGYCFERSVEPTCYGYGDEYSCVSDPSCEWVGEQGMDPMPCYCDPNDSTCICEPPPPAGFCQPASIQSCWDLSQQACLQDDACEWIEASGDMPVPAPPLCWEMGRLTDEGLCLDSTGAELPSECCDAVEPSGFCAPVTEPVPCYGLREAECLNDAQCSWNTNHGAPPMPECEGAEFGEDGLCYANGVEVMLSCCESGDGYGYCEPFAATCGANDDEASCASAEGCEWLPTNCEP
ncbi:MAG: hypothetical protein RBU37_20800, partial [Myxococcota bacterium]|nr:hypothetical protein [Myxococcota bacterium]